MRRDGVRGFERHSASACQKLRIFPIFIENASASLLMRKYHPVVINPNLVRPINNFLVENLQRRLHVIVVIL